MATEIWDLQNCKPQLWPVRCSGDRTKLFSAPRPPLGLYTNKFTECIFHRHVFPRQQNEEQAARRCCCCCLIAFSDCFFVAGIKKLVLNTGKKNPDASIGRKMRPRLWPRTSDADGRTWSRRNERRKRTGGGEGGARPLSRQRWTDDRAACHWAAATEAGEAGGAEAFWPWIWKARPL